MAFPWYEWTPIKPRVSTMEEAVKQLTAQVSTRPDWPYTLVWILMGMPTMCQFTRKGHLSILVEWRHQQCHLQKDQLTRGPQAPQLRFTGHLPSRAQWVWGPCDSLPTWVTGQRGKPAWRQTYLPKSGHPTIHCRGAKAQSASPWQPLNLPPWSASPIRAPLH